MNSAIHVKGLDKCLRQLNKELKRIERDTLKGLITIGLKIQGASQKRTPVDTGNLRASHFTMWGKNKAKSHRFSDKKGERDRVSSDHMIAQNVSRGKLDAMREPAVEVGVSAYYAVYVHENLSASHKVGEALFLQKAVEEILPKAKGIVKVAIWGK